MGKPYPMKNKILYAILGIILLGIVGFILFGKPIPQDIDYHNFSKDEDILSIENFWNVLSNVIFAFAGVYGLLKLKHEQFKIQLSIFYLGVVLVAFGSAYYHFAPNNETLIWDRLPMTLAFMALLSAVISEFHNNRLGKILLLPLLLIGLYSILNWIWFDDLKLYIAVQFFPILFILTSIIGFKKNQSTKPYWVLTAAYFIAKLFEHFDQEIGDLLINIGGHPFKHLSAGVGIILFAYLRNKKIKMQ